MEQERLRNILNQVAGHELSAEDAMSCFQQLLYQDLGFAKIDHHRTVRCGFPEVIFCEGKKPDQVAEIFRQMAVCTPTILGTRADNLVSQAVKEVCPDVQYFETARCLVRGMPENPVIRGLVLVISAGTADLPVAEEAVVCARALGNDVECLFDVGVSGLHRLLDHQDNIRKASVIIVVAGMEGALPSVVGGLTDKPVIAVPTSIGYGASFGGLAALLGMLNSCAPGVAVVNIDNGFGAAMMAAAINRLIS